MDCREAKNLLPLWIGQDLPDVASANEVGRHLDQCSSCNRHRNSLQSSLESLQCSTADTFSNEFERRSVWPKLVLQISEWEQNHRRERFNGWIPASVMALAVALMVAVSIPSIHEEFFGSGATLTNTMDLFAHDSELHFNDRSSLNPDSARGLHPQSGAFGTPVKLRLPPPEPVPDQW